MLPNLEVQEDRDDDCAGFFFAPFTTEQEAPQLISDYCKAIGEVMSEFRNKAPHSRLMIDYDLNDNDMTDPQATIQFVTFTLSRIPHYHLDDFVQAVNEGCASLGSAF